MILNIKWRSNVCESFSLMIRNRISTSREIKRYSKYYSISSDRQRQPLAPSRLPGAMLKKMAPFYSVQMLSMIRFPRKKVHVVWWVGLRAEAYNELFDLRPVDYLNVDTLQGADSDDQGIMLESDAEAPNADPPVRDSIAFSPCVSWFPHWLFNYCL